MCHVITKTEKPNHLTIAIEKFVCSSCGQSWEIRLKSDGKYHCVHCGEVDEDSESYAA